MASCDVLCIFARLGHQAIHPFALCSRSPRYPVIRGRSVWQRQLVGYIGCLLFSCLATDSGSATVDCSRLWRLPPPPSLQQECAGVPPDTRLAHGTITTPRHRPTNDCTITPTWVVDDRAFVRCRWSCFHKGLCSSVSSGVLPVTVRYCCFTVL